MRPKRFWQERHPPDVEAAAQVQQLQLLGTSMGWRPTESGDRGPTTDYGSRSSHVGTMVSINLSSSTPCYSSPGRPG